jgi:UDP-2,3-diacylglucosamine hydrolase
VTQRALFIADLHLAGGRPAANEQFFRFLQEEAARADALYVLGDLFESWAGDDEPRKSRKGCAPSPARA